MRSALVRLWYAVVFTMLRVCLGPRACIGRKFGSVEAVCWLTALLRDWRVEIVLESGETREGWRERVLQAELITTLAVGPVPIRLVRRR